MTDLQLAASNQFLPGDVVRVKSGGIDMTVKQVIGKQSRPASLAIPESHTVQVVYFDGSKLMEAWFDPAMLTKTP